MVTGNVYHANWDGCIYEKEEIIRKLVGGGGDKLPWSQNLKQKNAAVNIVNVSWWYATDIHFIFHSKYKILVDKLSK